MECLTFVNFSICSNVEYYVVVLQLTEDGLQRMSNGKLANALQELHIDECLLEKSAESMLTTLKSCIEKRNRVSSPISEEDSHSE